MERQFLGEKSILSTLWAVNFSLKKKDISCTFLQQVFPQQLDKQYVWPASDGVGLDGAEVAANFLGAPLKGRSISTNSRS